MSSSVGIFRSNNRWFQGNRSDCTASKASHANITRLSSCQSTKLSFRKFFLYVLHLHGDYKKKIKKKVFQTFARKYDKVRFDMLQ